MRQQSSPGFRDERGRYALRFTCEHCTYFHTEAGRCMHGFPNAAHREAHYAPEAGTDELLFCKEFELF